ncbi:hypothetical protein Pelo_19523 [Pelomyxa schiedti]|nr:hypothetical protein Pelo_19523 [Pelomyxa schiedti]
MKFHCRFDIKGSHSLLPPLPSPEGILTTRCYSDQMPITSQKTVRSDNHHVVLRDVEEAIAYRLELVTNATNYDERCGTEHNAHIENLAQLREEVRLAQDKNDATKDLYLK